MSSTAFVIGLGAFVHQRRKQVNLPLALYRVKLGRNAGNDQTDNWMSRDVLAKNAADAIKRVKRSKSEYVAEVVLLGRADE